ncbi:glycosyltransferase family 2 protein [Bacteroides thetaiotaomicron]|uniref:glycosyltransferase family 2 protein n=1 Tax=Bacteroides thetaiotaomicron TaxID=818 RepID=UPI0039C1DC0D
MHYDNKNHTKKTIWDNHKININHMPIISVIIPVYNVGKYIENSMKSVIAQRFADFEVILVDNNTPDDSIEIAEKVLAGTNINYRVVKQTIQGLPAARNKGIEKAKGEWIISIDPDDTISSFFLQELYRYATDNNLPVVFGEYDEVTEENLFIFPEENKEGAFELLDREYTMENLLTRRLPLMVSNMFFKKSFFCGTPVSV